MATQRTIRPGWMVIATTALAAALVSVMSVGRTAWAAPQGSCSTGSYVETVSGSDYVGTFTSPSITASSTGCTWSVPTGVTSVRVLVVGGGGGGGGFHTAGGGGAGGLIHEIGFAVTPNATLSIVVGKGGSAGSAVGSQYTNPGGNGSDSIFDSLTAVGGGGGGGGGANSQIGNPGSAGGSGGGGGRCWVSCNTGASSNGVKHAGGAGTATQGNPGGHAWFMSGGGGGGAGAAGSDDIYGAAGAGGDGLSIDISGSATYYAGGGGGGTENTATRATGGLGGGGLGGSTADSVGADGAPGTGGGGGGARWTGSNGGSGVVVVRWGAAPVAPNISLSKTTGYTVVNTAASDLYTITNTGGAATSYSIAPSLPSGLLFDSATGLISGTPTAVSALTTYTVTATRLNAANGASSSATATFAYAVYSTAPTTTTTTTTTSTTTTSTTTTVPASTTTAVPTTASAASPVSTSVTTTTALVSSPAVVTAGGTTPVTVAKSLVTGAATVPTTIVPASTTTASPTTTTTVPAPDAPPAEPGDASAILGGKEVDAKVSRSDNSLIVTAGGISATVYGIDAGGAKIALDADGTLNLSQGETIKIEASGFEESSTAEVWLRSTPVRLGAVAVDVGGSLNGSFVVPKGVEAGNHRAILSGRSMTGDPAVIGVGIHVGSYGRESNVSRWVISFAIALAVILALVIPTSTRRRRRAATHG